MQEFIDLYNQYQSDIEKFLIETLSNNGQLIGADVAGVQRMFRVLPSLELVYIADEEFNQTTPNIYRNRIDNFAKGKNRKYLVPKLEEIEKNVSISRPYLSSATGEACVTAMLFAEGEYYFFDFNLTTLLSRFGLVERHPVFNTISKGFYLGIGISLIFFALMSIGYAFYDYYTQLVNLSQYSLESVFKPIVALTLGLAIFDLAKTLLEREVIYKAYSDKKDEARLLSKFLSAIIIALSIEALMVVFKTALNDPSQMLYALFLIIGVALIILSLAIYNKLVIKDKDVKS